MLRQLRAELAGLLAGAGVPALDHEPARPAPPQALITPGNPYLEDGDEFGRRRVRLRVRLIVPMSDTALDALDDLLEVTLPALEDGGAGELIGDGWTVQDVAEPFTLLANGVGYPCLELTVATGVYL